MRNCQREEVVSYFRCWRSFLFFLRKLLSFCWTKMAATLRPYLNAVRSTLTASMCLENFDSQVVERHNKPEVEVRSGKELLLTPVVISRNERESSYWRFHQFPQDKHRSKAGWRDREDSLQEIHAFYDDAGRTFCDSPKKACGRVRHQFLDNQFSHRADV